MALVINDRVKETTTTTGTGAVSLAGAVTGFETFAAGIGNSNTVYYCIAHQDQAEFEVGLGTLDGDSSDLTRTTVISSSNSDSAVNFSSGTKDVFCTLPASKLIFEDANNDATVGRNLTVTGDLTVSGDDITLATNTSGAALIGDGTNFNPVVISGDVSIASNGAASLAATQTNVTSLKNTSLVVGRDADNDIDFATDNNIIFRASGQDQIVLKDGVIEPVTDDDIALGTTGSKRFTNLFLSGAIVAGGGVTAGGNLNINGSFEIDVASGDPSIILDTQGADKFHIAVDDSDSDNFVIKSGGTVGSGNGLKLDSSGNLIVTADVTVGDDLTVEGGVVDVKNTGAQSVVRFYCESSNAHYAQIQAPAHSAFSGNVTLTLPAATDTLVGRATTDTLTNKSIDSDNNTITNIVNADIKSSAAIADTKLATISTAGKVALTALEIDGGSDIGADLTTSDLIIVDDGAGGTNKKAALSRMVTLMAANLEDPTALAIALG